jgi:hypothetical protein
MRRKNEQENLRENSKERMRKGFREREIEKEEIGKRE